MNSKTISFEEFCASKGVAVVLPEITGVSEKVKNQMLATYQWEFIVKTLNDEGQEIEWEPDYANDDEDKWELWVEYSPASGWSLHAVGNWHSFRAAAPAEFLERGKSECMQVQSYCIFI